MAVSDQRMMMMGEDKTRQKVCVGAIYSDRWRSAQTKSIGFFLRCLLVGFRGADLSISVVLLIVGVLGVQSG